ncbi:MAG TPA: hypothetical protein VHQ65_16530 [Thermoanaerobaculia bacterium]|nr:hypothetical protein [Thermoanaerobaculia bacterium]
MKKTSVLLAVLCLGLAFALPAAADSTPAELTLDLFVTEATACSQGATPTTPAEQSAGNVVLFEQHFGDDLAAGENCGGVICGKGTYCCNASCAWCRPYGMSCIQIACN